MNTLGPQGSYPETIARLNALAAELSAHGWTTSVRQPRGKPPTLHACNPEPGAAALSERIYARPRADGTWTYWWPWTEPIAETPGDAAAIIIRVLRSATGRRSDGAGSRRVERSASSNAPSDSYAATPGQQRALPNHHRADGDAALENALRNAEQFLVRSSAAVHPGLSARTMLRYLDQYRTHLWTVIDAHRRQQHA